MNIINKLLGNASEISASDLQLEYQKLLANGEIVIKGYKLIRDVFMFSSYRLIIIDKQGITGNKIEYKTIPYKNISCFSVETAGVFDLDAELKIWISGIQDPIKLQFSKGVDIYMIQSILAEYVYKKS